MHLFRVHGIDHCDRRSAGFQYRTLLVKAVGNHYGCAQTDHYRWDHLLSFAAGRELV